MDRVRVSRAGVGPRQRWQQGLCGQRDKTALTVRTTPQGRLRRWSHAWRAVLGGCGL